MFQERVLSPRIFHFCENHVWWECCSLLASEALPEGLLSIQKDGESVINRKNPTNVVELCTNSNRLGSLAKPINLSGMDSTEPALSRRDEYLEVLKGQPPFEPNVAWRSCVGIYSSCKLTYPKDKLMAISGVATAFRSWIKDEFFAGMWKRQILEDLLWSKVGRDPLSPLPELKAPTWSGLSVGGKISVPTYDHIHRPFTLHTVCLEIPVMQGNSKTLDIATDAHIRLPGSLKRARLHETSLHRFRAPSRVCGQAIQLYQMNLDLVLSELPQMPNQNYHSGSLRSVDFPLMTKAGISMISTTDIFLLPLLTVGLLIDGWDHLAGLYWFQRGGEMASFSCRVLCRQGCKLTGYLTWPHVRHLS